jgi:hypothetical protein
VILPVGVPAYVTVEAVNLFPTEAIPEIFGVPVMPGAELMTPLFIVRDWVKLKAVPCAVVAALVSVALKVRNFPAAAEGTTYEKR